MDTSIYKNLKENFVKSTNINNRSLVELCITELSSGNITKAIDLSEELVKNDINDSVGWATKAISQAYLFDYDEKLYLLKSSLTSLDEFKRKTPLTSNEIIKIESLFITTVLDRTIDLVTQRINEVISLRKKAQEEQAKAVASAFGAALSAFAGSKSKSDVGKILGYGGAVVGAAASINFSSNSQLLNEASKGVFGIAIANISMTIGSAITLKNYLNELNIEIREEAILTLKNWINTLAFLYQQVIENLLVYGQELKKKNIFNKSYLDSCTNMINTPEVTQFIYLTKILGIENTIPQFKELEGHLLKLNNFDKKEIKSSINLMNMLSAGSVIFSIFLFGGYSTIASHSENPHQYDEYTDLIINIFSFLFFGGALAFIFFNFNPIGKAGELKKSVNKLVDTIKNFKVSSDKIIVENMVPLDKSLN